MFRNFGYRPNLKKTWSKSLLEGSFPPMRYWLRISSKTENYLGEILFNVHHMVDSKFAASRYLHSNCKPISVPTQNRVGNTQSRIHKYTYLDIFVRNHNMVCTFLI